jgi:hypothetical protein
MYLNSKVTWFQWCDISILKLLDFYDVIPKTHDSYLTSELCFRTQLSRLRLITSWSNSLMEPPTNGADVNRRYHGVDTYVPKLWIHLALFVPISFDVKLGANAILAVSLAVCKAGAIVKKSPLYQVCHTTMIFLCCFFSVGWGCDDEGYIIFPTRTTSYLYSLSKWCDTLHQPDSSGGTLTYEVSHAWYFHSLHGLTHKSSYCTHGFICMFVWMQIKDSEWQSS